MRTERREQDSSESSSSSRSTKKRIDVMDDYEIEIEIETTNKAASQIEDSDEFDDAEEEDLLDVIATMTLSESMLPTTHAETQATDECRRRIAASVHHVANVAAAAKRRERISHTPRKRTDSPRVEAEEAEWAEEEEEGDMMFVVMGDSLRRGWRMRHGGGLMGGNGETRDMTTATSASAVSSFSCSSRVCVMRTSFTGSGGREGDESNRANVWNRCVFADWSRNVDEMRGRRRVTVLRCEGDASMRAQNRWMFREVMSRFVQRNRHHIRAGDHNIVLLSSSLQLVYFLAHPLQDPCIRLDFRGNQKTGFAPRIAFSCFTFSNEKRELREIPAIQDPKDFENRCAVLIGDSCARGLSDLVRGVSLLLDIMFNSQEARISCMKIQEVCSLIGVDFRRFSMCLIDSCLSSFCVTDLEIDPGVVDSNSPPRERLPSRIFDPRLSPQEILFVVFEEAQDLPALSNVLQQRCAQISRCVLFFVERLLESWLNYVFDSVSMREEEDKKSSFTSKEDASSLAFIESSLLYIPSWLKSDNHPFSVRKLAPELVCSCLDFLEVSHVGVGDFLRKSHFASHEGEVSLSRDCPLSMVLAQADLYRAMCTPSGLWKTWSDRQLSDAQRARSWMVHLREFYRISTSSRGFCSRLLEHDAKTETVFPSEFVSSWAWNCLVDSISSNSVMSSVFRLYHDPQAKARPSASAHASLLLSPKSSTEQLVASVCDLLGPCMDSSVGNNFSFFHLYNSSCLFSMGQDGMDECSKSLSLFVKHPLLFSMIPFSQTYLYDHFVVYLIEDQSLKWNSVPRIQAIDLVVDRYAREMHVPKDNCVLHGSGEDFVFIAPAFVSYLDREARSLKSGAARSISRWYRYYAGLKKIRAQKLILCGAAICIQSAWRGYYERQKWKRDRHAGMNSLSCSSEETDPIEPSIEILFDEEYSECSISNPLEKEVERPDEGIENDLGRSGRFYSEFQRNYAAIVLQERVLRRIHARVAAAVRIQRWYRAISAQRAAWMEVAREYAAIAIQRAWRYHRMVGRLSNEEMVETVVVSLHAAPVSPLSPSDFTCAREKVVELDDEIISMEEAKTAASSDPIKYSSSLSREDKKTNGRSSHRNPITSVLKRQEEFLQRVKSRREKLREEIREREVAEMRSIPKINKRSSQFSVSESRSLLARQEAYVQKKQRVLAEMEAELNSRSQEGLTFHPLINKKSKRLRRTYEDRIRWRDSVEKKKQELAAALVKRELGDHPFQPLISRTTDAESRISVASTPFEERLYVPPTVSKKRSEEIAVKIEQKTRFLHGEQEVLALSALHVPTSSTHSNEMPSMISPSNGFLKMNSRSLKESKNCTSPSDELENIKNMISSSSSPPLITFEDFRRRRVSSSSSASPEILVPFSAPSHANFVMDVESSSSRRAKRESSFSNRRTEAFERLYQGESSVQRKSRSRPNRFSLDSSSLTPPQPSVPRFIPQIDAHSRRLAESARAKSQTQFRLLDRTLVEEWTENQKGNGRESPPIVVNLPASSSFSSLPPPHVSTRQPIDLKISSLSSLPSSVSPPIPSSDLAPRSSNTPSAFRFASRLEEEYARLVENARRASSCLSASSRSTDAEFLSSTPHPPTQTSTLQQRTSTDVSDSSVSTLSQGRLDGLEALIRLAESVASEDAIFSRSVLVNGEERSE